MAKFYGEIGYGETLEVPVDSGVFKDVITERKYFGDEVKTARQLVQGSQLNDDLKTDTSIEIVADAYAFEHFFAIRYVRWAGVYWKVVNVTVRRPRLVLRLGGVYNGPKA
jgi:hypothetical protein